MHLALERTADRDSPAGVFGHWSAASLTPSPSESGSDYNDDNDDYIFTTTSTDTYYLIFDNSGSIGSAAATGTTVTGNVDVIVSTPSSQHLKTRAWVDVGSFVELNIGSVQSGKIISTSVSCDIGITSSDDLDFLYMDSLQTSTLQTSQWISSP